jgi:uncharacterized lipoprotein YajG
MFAPVLSQNLRKNCTSTVPDESFKVMVYGETQKGNPFTRTSQATITPSYGILQAVNNVIISIFFSIFNQSIKFSPLSHETVIDFLVD